MARIRIDYDRTIRKASEIQELSHEMKNITRDLDDLLIQAKSTWKGEASLAYTMQGEKLKQSIKDTSCAMEQLAGKIKYAADEIKRLDEEQARRKMR